LPDPKGLLQGGGRQGRFVRLPEAAILSTPAVAALLDSATKAARTPFPAGGKWRTVIKAVAATQRARRART